MKLSRELRALVDDVCARSQQRLLVPTPREWVEASIVSWYATMNRTAPVVLWAESPTHATTLVTAIAAGADACDPVDGVRGALEYVAAWERVITITARLDPAEVDAIASGLVGHTDRQPARPLRSDIESASLRLLVQLDAHFGANTVYELHDRIWRRVAPLRSSLTSIASHGQRWYRDRPLDEDPLRPVPQRWFVPELLRVARVHGLAAVDPWMGWVTASESATAWWALNRFAIVCAPPAVVELDGQGRVHAERGPAIRWTDGSVQHVWRETPVPSSLIEGPWSSATILRTENVEIRRCAIERVGWEKFIVDLGFSPVGAVVPDPANPGFELALFDVPRGIIGDGFRMLLCTNASPERDGTRRRFAIPVPARTPGPLEAAAWTFGIDPSAYALLGAAS